PPPPPTICPLTINFDGGAPPNAFQIHCISNLNIGDSVINITNTGASSTTAFPTQNGNVCANIYAFSPDEQMISCCQCLVTPNALVSLSARRDLINYTLTPGVPTSIVVKIVTTVTGGDTAALADGGAAWATNIHALPTTLGTPAGTFGQT